MDDATISAMKEALDDEYKALATYRKVLATFGPVAPFENIAESEQRHVRALLRLFEAAGVAPPPDDWSGRVEIPTTVKQCCEVAVQAEIENLTMYDKLMEQVSEPRVRTVLARLREASSERHLPAFRRCSSRSEGAGNAGGGRRRRFRGGRGSSQDPQ